MIATEINSVTTVIYMKMYAYFYSSPRRVHNQIVA